MTKFWHGLVLGFSAIGLAVAARLGLAAWGIAEETPEDQVLWWCLAGGCAILAVVFAREVWLRLARLRRPQGD